MPVCQAGSLARRDPERRLESLPPAVRGLGGFLVIAVAALALAAVVVGIVGVIDGEQGVDPDRVLEAAVEEGGETDPFAWRPGRERALEAGAALGHSHVLYERSPGGIVASARRTARFADGIAAAADAHGTDAELMEAMVLLESAGRPEVIAGGSDPANASGIAQILASTGLSLLGMEIDLARSTELTAALTAALAEAAELRERAAKLASRGPAGERRAAKLAERADELERRAGAARRERARVDDRFDPVEALDGMGRYLAIARERFGRTDLAATSYHMGIGNLGDVIEAYAGGSIGDQPIGELVADAEISYPRLYFDSSPIRNQGAWRILDGFSDDSATYWWRVLAAREIMRLYRDDREELRRLAGLHGNKATAEEVFHPPGETMAFDDPAALEDAIGDGGLERIPDGRPYGYRVGPQLGQLAPELGVDRELYRALTPEALAALIYITGRVQAITGERGPRHDLIVTSAVRDRDYQQALVGRNAEASPSYSLHTTGNSFDILRSYANDRQAAAFQFVLDRMRSLGVIDWAREPRAIHVTASPLATRLLE